MVDARDAFFMRQALRLAERGRGGTSPNPMVGALVVDGEGVIVGRGAHEIAGGPHAEVHALREAGPCARGATLYCTLEPCAHQGRTGPCAPLVQQAGIARAVIATEDPNPLVAGRGIGFLRSHGIEVACGVMAEEAARLNAAFFSVMRKGRPYVTMKIATSLDGAVAAAAGSRTAISGPESIRHAHSLRAEVDAIAVGSGTVLTDDPILTARVAYRRRPLTRVVFDRRLRTPPHAALFGTLSAGPVVVVTSSTARDTQRDGVAHLEGAGANIVEVEADAPLRESLRALVRLGITSLLVEGGTALHRAFWDAGLVDRVQMYVAPHTLGPDAVRWIDEPIISAGPTHEHYALPLGEDALIEAYVHRTD